MRSSDVDPAQLARLTVGTHSACYLLEACRQIIFKKPSGKGELAAGIQRLNGAFFYGDLNVQALPNMLAELGQDSGQLLRG